MKQRVARQRVGFAATVFISVAACGSADAGSPDESGASPPGPAGAPINSMNSMNSVNTMTAGAQAQASGAATMVAPDSAVPTAGPSGPGLAVAGAGGAPTAGVSGSAGGPAVATTPSAAAGAAAEAASPADASAGPCGSESFAAIYDSIFANTVYNCTGALCHGRAEADAMPVGDLSLSSAAVAYTQLVGVDSPSMACGGMARVVPGDPEGSLLVQKLRGATTTCGGVMPVGAEEITDDELKRITDWIGAGACDN